MVLILDYLDTNTKPLLPEYGTVHMLGFAVLSFLALIDSQPRSSEMQTSIPVELAL